MRRLVLTIGCGLMLVGAPLSVAQEKQAPDKPAQAPAQKPVQGPAQKGGAVQKPTQKPTQKRSRH